MKKWFALVFIFISVTAQSESFEAVIEPYRRVLISSQMDGVIEQSLKLSESFEKGTILFTQKLMLIDSKIEQNKLYLEREQKRKSFYDQQYIHKKKLFDKDFITEDKLLEIELKKFEVESELSSLKIEQKMLMDKVNFSKVKAPFSGTVSKVFKQESEYAKIGEACIQLIDDLKLLAICNIPSEKAVRGNNVKIKIGFKIYSGVISTVAPESYAATGKDEVRILINNQNKEIKPGQKCMVLFD